MSHDHGQNESKVLLKPKKIISRVKSHSQDHSEAVDFFKSVYHAVVESMGPDCPFDRIAEDPSTGVGSVPIRIDACAQTETAIDEILQSETAVNGAGGAPAIRVDSSSEEDTKENVLVESLKMKAVLRTMKNEKLDEPESSLHFVVIENLPPTITASDLERDMFTLVDIDKKTLALNIVRANKAECSVQVYTNDQRQAQKILACNKKVVVGGRVITTRKGMV